MAVASAPFEMILASLARPGAALQASSVRGVLDAIDRDDRAFEQPIDAAIFHAGRVDRMGYAFAAGYAAATRALVSSISAPAGRVQRRISLAATEDGGAHPRAIRTALGRGAGGGAELTGNKLWCTLASEATHLLIIATEGEHDGRPRLRAALVPRDRGGVTLSEMAETPFCPEIHHARVELANVEVKPDELIDGDAFTLLLKPFRTIEDLYVQAALLAWLAATSRRLGFEPMLTARCFTLLAAVRELARRPPVDAAVHIALGGLLHESTELLAALDQAWQGAPQPERERFARDRPLLSIAARVRDERLRRAWQTVAEQQAT